MTKTIDALVEALEFVISRFGPNKSNYLFSQRLALDKAEAALAQARAAQAQEPTPAAVSGDGPPLLVRLKGLGVEPVSRAEQAEPVAWMFQHDETGRTVCLANDGVNTPENFEESNPRLVLVCPLYRRPGAGPVAWRYTANGHVILMDGPNPPPDDAYDEGSLVGLAPTCKDGLQVPTDKESLTVAPSAKLKPLTDDEVDALWESSEKFQNPYLAYIHGVVDAEAAHNAKLGGA